MRKNSKNYGGEGNNNLQLAKRSDSLLEVLDSGEQVDEEAILAEMSNIEDAAESSGWGDLLSEYAEATANLHFARVGAKRFDAFTAYRNTAGEIEARDAAARRTFSQEQRRQTPPDLGGEDTVFADKSGDSFSIETLPDGERIAVINEGQDAFKGQPRSRWAAIARRILLKKFKGQALPLGQEDLARITKEQAEEYAYPRNQYPTESSEFAAKMRAAPELDHLLETAEYSHWARDTKHHPEATFGFDYFNVRFIVGEHLFEGLVNIANSENGRIFYDVTKVKEIPDTSGKYVALMARSSSAFGNLFDDRIHGNTEKVNTNFDIQKSMGRSFDELVADIRRQRQSSPAINDPLLADIKRSYREKDISPTTATTTYARNAVQIPEARRADFDQATKIAEKFGAKVRVGVLENGASGEYQDGTIIINPETKKPRPAGIRP